MGLNEHHCPARQAENWNPNTAGSDCDWCGECSWCDNLARAASPVKTATEQTAEDRHGPWIKEWERYEDGCREDRPHVYQPGGESRG